jgi:hypothetical protein
VLSSLIFKTQVKLFTKVWHCTKLQNSTHSGSVCSSITSKLHTIAIFKSYVKENYDSHKTCIYVHDLSLYKTTSMCSGSWVVSIKQNVNFNFQPVAMFVFLVFHKWSYWKLFILWRSISIQIFIVPCWLVQILYPPQKSERLPFWNG